MVGLSSVKEIAITGFRAAIAGAATGAVVGARFGYITDPVQYCFSKNYIASNKNPIAIIRRLCSSPDSIFYIKKDCLYLDKLNQKELKERVIFLLSTSCSTQYLESASSYKELLQRQAEESALEFSTTAAALFATIAVITKTGKVVLNSIYGNRRKD